MRVVIVEDQKLFLDALATALQAHRVEVAGRATDVASALAEVTRHQPDVALLDIHLPPGLTDEGLRLAETLRGKFPRVGLLILSANAEVAYAERVLNIEDDARGVGYLLKERVGDVSELIDAITRVAGGGVVIDPQVVRRLMSRRRLTDPLAVLTAHERRVLALVAEGRSNQAIATETGAQVSTVEKHLSVIVGKLGLKAGVDRRSVNVRVLAALEYLRNVT